MDFYFVNVYVHIWKQVCDLNDAFQLKSVRKPFFRVRSKIVTFARENISFKSLDENESLVIGF